MGYDLQDPWDLSRLEGDFASISQEEWQQFFDYASEGDNWKRFDKKALYIGLTNAGKTRRISAKQMNWALSVVEAIEKAKEKKEANQAIEQKLENNQFNQSAKHFTLRVAWHDSAWNGHVCKDPEANRYCSGYHSLLSERIRRNKEESIAEEIKYAGKSIADIDYLPPCYWSINLNATKPATVNHINPAAPKELAPIQEELAANAMFSWPFAISFNRTAKQMQAEGAYPPNLDNVRIPLFREKVKEKSSIAFFYAKFSNPFTEEERQYLVIGAALIKDKGELLEFGPLSAIEAKRKKLSKNKNFPVQNWALQFKFDETLKVTMPYHEYLAKANSISDSAQRQAMLDKIKVAISEPELTHCFKYVAMDIDDDESIYILSKMRQKLLDCKNDGVINPEEITKKLQTVDELSKHCWKHRGYFPGFVLLSELLLGRETKLQQFYNDIEEETQEELDEKLSELITDPKSDPSFKAFKNDFFDLKEALDTRGLSIAQFLKLSMLNLTKYQFERILEKKVKDFDRYRHQVSMKDKTPVEDICNNPYLLVEEYAPEEGKIDENTGEELDRPIELFKVDIAYFPDARVMPRLDLQRGITVSHKYRLRCLIINYLNSLEQKGDCFEDATELENALRQYPLFYQQGTEFTLKTDILKESVRDRDSFFEENDTKLKLIDANDTRYYYLNEIFEAEKTIGDKIHELLSQPKNDLHYRDLQNHITKSINKLSSNDSFVKEDFKIEREELYENIFKNRVYLLAGGPGSGKSHELLNILQEIKDQGENYLLLTPTGKAALRLKSDKEYPAIEASTIDKWLTEVEHGKFSREKISRINNLIIDEMSMVDLLKFLRVLNHLQFSKPSFKRLILVGDPNQLPAIGYGKVLKDILYFLKSHSDHHSHYIELSGNLRSELSGNKVIELSRAFEEKGEPTEEVEPILHTKSGDKQISEGFRIAFYKDDTELKQKIEQEFQLLCNQNKIKGNKQESLHQLLGLTKDGKFRGSIHPNLENFQILSPYLSGISGTDGLNDYFQKTFKSDFVLKLAKGYYKESDKIIRTKNYYEDEELLLSNGSIGLIQKENNESLFFQENEFEEIKLKDIRKADKEFFDLAYAISIHKSQGSGFDHLFIVIPDRPGLLSKELIYTALTRCRKSVTLFIQNVPEKPNKKNLLETARTRTFTDSRKTSLLLNQPFRYFSLEPEEGVFVQSRTELMIYHALKTKRDEVGNDKFDFFYEKYPTKANGKELKIKSDFTVISKGKTWYWEHLGRLGNRIYERNWQKLKRPTYTANGFETALVTSDELKGISTEKIDALVEMLYKGDLVSEDNKNKYSALHFSLR
jgi:exodeoxyribonuclease V alpha subunit